MTRLRRLQQVCDATGPDAATTRADLMHAAEVLR